MVIEFLQIILECVAKLISIRSTFFITLAIAFILSIGCWAATAEYYPGLWNTRYQLTKLQHFFCATAAMLTFMGVIAYQSLEYTAPITEAVVKTWQLGLKNDGSWSENTFRKAYEEVKAMGKEDFSNFPPPEQGGRIIPSSHEETGNKIALIYATQAVADFKTNHTYLSEILWANSEPSAQAISQDHKDFFKQNSGQSYPLERAINLAARLISDELSAQIPRVVTLSRLTIFLLILMVQAIPLVIIAVAAYQDLKETV